MRYGWVRAFALVLMAAMLFVIAACSDNARDAMVHGQVAMENSSTTPEEVAEVLEGVEALYPDHAPQRPTVGVIGNFMIAYHVPGMEHVHGFTLPVQFYYEYLYSGEGMMEELDRVRRSLSNVEYDDSNAGRILLTGTAGQCVVNVTAFMKEGPDSLHYSVEMPETGVDIESFLKKIRVGPIGDMVKDSVGDVAYARHVFANHEQWVWGYLTDQTVEDMAAWYLEQAEALGYTNVTTEEQEGAVHVQAPGTAGKDPWTAQIQVSDRGDTYVSFQMVYRNR